MKPNRKSFTLVEIMIVVAIIALLSAVAIHNLLRVRIHSNENTVITTCYTLSNALQSFRAFNTATGFPAALTALAPAGAPSYLDNSLAVVAPVRNGYSFTYTQIPAEHGSAQYYIFAAPLTPNVTGIRGFYIDEQGLISAISPAGADPGHAPQGASAPDGYIILQQ